MRPVCLEWVLGVLLLRQHSSCCLCRLLFVQQVGELGGGHPQVAGSRISGISEIVRQDVAAVGLGTAGVLFRHHAVSLVQGILKLSKKIQV